MLAAMQEITRRRREGEISTAEARELKALAQLDYQAVHIPERGGTVLM